MKRERLRQLQWPDWRVIARRVWDETTADNVDVMAAGAAFFATLAVFPAVVALVLVYGLFSDPATLERQLTWLALALVPLAREVLSGSLELAAHQRTGFGFGVIVALVIATYGASRATNAVLLSIQAAYDDSSMRGYLAQLRLNLSFTAVAVTGSAVVLASAAAAPGILERLGFGPSFVFAVGLLRWPLLWCAFFLGVTQLYRFAPERKERLAWVATWPGALLSTVVWTGMSFGFTFYAARFGGYQGTYGPAAAFAVFMTWLYLTAYVVIAGAELNSEIARRLDDEAPENLNGASSIARDGEKAPTAPLRSNPAASDR